MPVFRFNKVTSMLQNIRLSLKRKRLQNKKQELARIKAELRTVKDPVERQERKKRKREKNQELLLLKSELRAARGQTESESETGALPDFVIIGVKKCGTTTLYRLLTQHPLVQSAALKEPHFFINHFEEGIEWYRRCFPAPRWRNGERSITGEATPKYLHHPLVPERMAKTIPQARLMALLRNPVDRAYSDYQQMVRKGLEPRTFEEAIEDEMLAPSFEKGNNPASTLDHEYLSRGLYVDQLRHWSKFFSDDQILVLKSEDFFERPSEILKRVLRFLDLPDWEPEGWEIRKQGTYEQAMDPATRQRLEEYFEPYNQRLYKHLGVDFGW